ncbi:MAG: glycoside hydrolase family 55 protein [Tannerella sp.]|jgi:hypothetical protein|nr:glycoside hydrolase family 55 protein [Tannerella sp.]
MKTYQFPITGFIKPFICCFVISLLCGIGTISAKEKTPVLAGDGVADDTRAIQAILDSGQETVYLPVPKKCYLISKALRIHSNQTLRLDPNTVIKLADNSNDYLLINDNREKGDKNIRIIGGIWDCNNARQTCGYRENIRNSSPFTTYMGCGMFLMNIENLWIEGLTIKDPETFGVHLAKVRMFTVKDIVFDYNMELINEDGIHIKGPSSHGFIQNLKGNTNDDMVALNADDQDCFEPSRGPITDIRIDGLYAPNGFTAVRLLSAGSPVKRVHISNIYGTFRYNVVSFTQFGLHKGEPRLFEDITIDNVYVARLREPDGKPAKERRHVGEHTPSKLTDEEIADDTEPWYEAQRKGHPFFWIQDGVTIDKLTISDIARHEWLPGTQPLITIDKDVKILNLKLRDILQENNTDQPLPLILNEGTIERLLIDNVEIREKNEANKVQSFTGGGKVVEKHGDFFMGFNKK